MRVVAVLDLPLVVVTWLLDPDFLEDVVTLGAVDVPARVEASDEDAALEDAALEDAALEDAALEDAAAELEAAATELEAAFVDVATTVAPGVDDEAGTSVVVTPPTTVVAVVAAALDGAVVAEAGAEVWLVCWTEVWAADVTEDVSLVTGAEDVCWVEVGGTLV